MADDVQSLCARGQERLIATDYLAAERLLAEAERRAWDARDWDALARLYMPLQEARRQRRQRCGEGAVVLDLFPDAHDDSTTPTALRSDVDAGARAILAKHPHGQLLVAGLASIAPALRVRELAAERALYVETFLAAAYRVGASFVVAVVPTGDVALPPDDGRPLDRLLATWPPFSVVLGQSDIVRGGRPGSDATYAETMALWERLHAPFLAAAEATTDPIRRMAAFRRTIEVDYACEFAHQHLAATAHRLSKKG